MMGFRQLAYCQSTNFFFNQLWHIFTIFIRLLNVLPAFLYFDKQFLEVISI